MASGYREAVDAIPEVIFRIDDRGVFELLSASWCATTGFAVDTSVGRPAIDFFHPDDRVDVEAKLVTLLCGRSDGKTFSARLVSASGAPRWIEITARTMKNRTGSVIGAAGTLRDVSEHHLRALLDDNARTMDIAIMNGASEKDVLEGVCTSLVASTRYPLVWIGRRRRDGSAVVAAFAGRSAREYFGAAPDGFSDLDGPCGVAMSGTSPRHVHFDPDAIEPWHRRALAIGLCSALLVPLRSRDGAMGVLVAFSDDVSTLGEHARTLETLAGRVSLSLQLAAHQERLEIQAAAMQASHDALFITTPEGDVIWVNTAFERMTGCSAKLALGSSPVIFADNPQDTEQLGSMWRAAVAGAMWRGELGIRSREGTKYTVMLTTTPLSDTSGVVTHVVGTMVDVTAQRKAEALVNQMATRDALTQLPNRAVIVERLGALTDKSSVAVMFVDLDRFKLVNDTLGHAAGDTLLCEIGRRLQSCLREGDTVGRFGGDEFVVIAPSAGAPENASRVATRMLEALSMPLVLEGREIFPSASIGVALCPSDATDGERLVEMADTAMYDAKQKGRNGFAFFAEELREKASAGLNMHGALHRALQRDEIALQFQPQIDLGSGAIVGVEALARWRSSELGVVSPSEFIPLAESTGLIGALDELVLKKACTTMKAMREKRIPIPRMSVNLSGALFASGRIVDVVDQTLVALDLPANVLELEVSERVLVQDNAAVAKAFEGLRLRGVRIVLDDFGTGFSSLSFLRKRPVDALKLDRSFMAGLPHDRDALVIAELVFAVARTLGLDAVAEGVETEAQAAALETLGCRVVQGYLTCHPLDPSELEAFATSLSIARAA